MLNDADGHGGGEADEAREKLTDADAIFLRLKKQVKADYNSKGQVNWRRRRAKTSTEQLSDDDKAILQDARAPDSHFQPCRNDGRQRSWSGSRQPQKCSSCRAGSALKKNELLTSAAVSPVMRRGRGRKHPGVATEAIMHSLHVKTDGEGREVGTLSLVY